MFNGRCFKESCQNKVYAKCDCEGNVLFCYEHGYEHWQKPSSNRHQLIQLFFKPAEEIKQPIIQKLTELKKDIQAYKKEAISNASKVITSFKAAFRKYLDQISEVDKRCSEMIEGLLNDEKFLDIANENEMESVLKLDAQKANMKMHGWSTNWCSLDYKEINTAISRTYEIPFDPFRIDYEYEIESNELSFFRHGTSNFSTISLDNFQVSSMVTLSTQENIADYISTCLLPDKTYFYCCNPSSSSGITFTIDKNRNVKQLQKSKLNSHLDPIFYKNFIYLLGGNNKLAERYDLKQNLWQSMAPLPQDLDSRYSCNSLFGDLILISGNYIQKIITYSIIQDTYKDIANLVLDDSRSKFMVRGNNRVYLFEKGKRTFESAENDITNWIQIGNNTLPNNNHNQSAVVRYKGSLYFVKPEGNLWKFDLSSKQVSHVTNV